MKTKTNYTVHITETSGGELFSFQLPPAATKQFVQDMVSNANQETKYHSVFVTDDQGNTYQ